MRGNSANFGDKKSTKVISAKTRNCLIYVI